MRFAILGPPEASSGGRLLPLGGPQQRALFALLLLHANRVVAADRLAEDLWDGQPPPAARRLLQGCVVRLRRALRDEAGEPGRQPLLARPPGYLLEVRPGELDVDRFDELVAAAEQRLRAPSAATLEEATALLREALALWRGPALDGLAPAACQATARRLDEQRQAALEMRIDADLYLGRSVDLIGELHAQVSAHPLNERLWAQLIVALHGAGRQADALAAYRQVRQALVEQLGVEPDAALSELQRTILSGGDALRTYRTMRDQGRPATATVAAPTPAPATPAQLPAAVTAFTGRAAHLKRLDALLPGAVGRTAAIAVAVVTGTAGVGKTALAVHWAYRVRDLFPDGQLYVDLRGYARTPSLRSIDALVGFLTALGVPAERIPVDVEQAAALYRTLLAGRRALVLLDNARSSEQVRPLLPGEPGCLVLVTGRDRLGGLVARDGAERITLDVLDADEADLLLSRLLGPQRVSVEPVATREFARACARLPLALRVAAADLDARPGRSIADFVADLTGGDRLAALRVDDEEDPAVRATFDLSYETLPAGARRLFRRLGLVPGPDATTGVAAALIGGTAREAGPLLDRLAGAHLISRHGGDRYAFHDLLRDYAADAARRDEAAAERGAALAGLFDWYLYSVDAAARVLYPGKLRLPLPAAGPHVAPDAFDSHATALSWLDAERANLVAAICHGAEHGPRRAAWLLADALRGYFVVGMHLADWLLAAPAALAAAEAEGDLAGQAAAQLSLADACMRQSRHPQAIRHYGLGLAAARQTGWLEGQAAALGNLGIVYWQMGQLELAAAQYAESLALDRESGRLAGEAINLTNLGNVYDLMGRLELAADHFRQALDVFRKLGSRSDEAIDLTNLGGTYHGLGRFDAAEQHLHQALDLLRETGDRVTEADALNLLAEVHRDAGRLDEAGRAAGAALDIARETGNSRSEADALDVLATVYHRRGRHAQAVNHHEQARRLAEEMQARPVEVHALVGLANAHRAAGRLDEARGYADRAVAVAGHGGYRVLEGRALTALAAIHLALDEPDDARRLAEQAREIQRETGHRLGEAHALFALGQALCRTAGREAALPLWREAAALYAAVGAPEAGDVRLLLVAERRGRNSTERPAGEGTG